MPSTKDSLLEWDFLRFCLSCNNYLLQQLSSFLAQPLDWEKFLSLLFRHRCAALVYKNIGALEDASVFFPAHIILALKDKYIENWAKNSLLLAQLAELQGLLHSQGIPFLIFKGLALAQMIYKDIGVRDSCDFDLLIRREDFWRLDGILRDCGYQSKIDPRQANVVYSSYRNSLMYHFRDSSKIPLHIHWHLFNVFIPQTKEYLIKSAQRFWQQAQDKDIAGLKIKTLSDNHLLIYLCWHALSHGFSELLLLCDVEGFLRSFGYHLDWEAIIDEARKLDLENCVYCAFYLCSSIFKTPIPQEILLRLAPKGIGFSQKKILARIEKGKVLASDQFFMLLNMQPGLGRRFYFGFKALFPPAEFLSLVRQKEAKSLNLGDYFKRIKPYLLSVPKMFS